ncbi:cobalt-precorrin-5B (C(1))-methyltransferase CbiD [Fusibacter sp. JL216-2]|uniref:cobalt-precorrin-5B (C(1))-methyltransferase CbiD n=1 Tax=Fusibacter sp. JL216-2 TaxID=3071453 RepID=UPI003D33FE0D
MDRFIEKDGKKLRYGFTTGSCATAAAKAATWMLHNQRKLEVIEIDTPKGWILSIPIVDIELTDTYAKCAVVKDAGDDPDVTHGMKVFAQVCFAKDYALKGGEGIGRVTKPGLSVPVGQPAINPVPRQMIFAAVHDVLPEGKTVEVVISAPEGVEKAKKTFNPKLGIVGGLSIIGTSGIVEPMSEDALKETMRVELKMLLASGQRDIIFAPGNYGRDYAKENSLDDKRIVKTSNFIGFMMDEAGRQNVRSVLWIGHLGKMVKVASGIFQTHSKFADGRMETLAAHLALLEAPVGLIKAVMGSNTTDEAVDHIKDAGYMQVFDQIANAITDRCIGRVYDEVNVGTIIFTKAHGYLGSCRNAKKLEEGFKI